MSGPFRSGLGPLKPRLNSLLININDPHSKDYKMAEINDSQPKAVVIQAVELEIFRRLYALVERLSNLIEEMESYNLKWAELMKTFVWRGSEQRRRSLQQCGRGTYWTS